MSGTREHSDPNLRAIIVGTTTKVETGAAAAAWSFCTVGLTFVAAWLFALEHGWL